METISLKALSDKVLRRNRPGNIMETLSFHARKPEGEKFPLPGIKTDIQLEPETISLGGTLQDFQAIFDQAVSDVGAVYLPGTLEMIRENFPDLAGEMEKIEERINELWLRAKVGQGDMGAYRQAVGRWRGLHLRGINFFSVIEGYTGG